MVMDNNTNKGKKSIVGKLVVLAIVIVLCIPIIMDVVSSNSLKKVEYDDFKETISNTQSYGFALIYVANSKAVDIDENKKNIKDMVEKYAETSTNTKAQAYYMDSNDLSDSELKDILGESVKTGYVFAINGEIIKTVTGVVTNSKLDGLISLYTMNSIPEDLVYFKVAESASDYKKLVNDKKKVTMAVFGRDNCFYCNQFKAVYNTVAEEENVDIYYFDSNSYDDKEYEKIMNFGLKVPASCSSDGKEFELGSGFATPLTLFTKNGKVIDCISGYINKEQLITRLETVGLIDKE